jgi:integrase
VSDFVEQMFLPFYRRKWKPSTAVNNEYRITAHLIPQIGDRPIGSLSREELQTLLDRKANEGLSHSMVSHIRWDLKQVFDLAQTEGYVSRNPAVFLFVPRDALRIPQRIMTVEEVKIVCSKLEQRERLILKLAILAGMRPGEIFGLKWGRLRDHHV